MLMMSVTATPAKAGGQIPGVTPQDSSPQRFKIAGTVVDAMTGNTLTRVRVTLASTRAPAQRVETITGEGGQFEFAGVPVGKYSLRGAKSGYLASTYQEHEHFSTALVTGPEFATEKLVLELMPVATIAGHVLDESGEPVRSAQILLFMEDHDGGMNRVVTMSAATSDDRGYFDIGTLRPGTYFVSANAKPWYAVYPPGELTGRQVSPGLDVAYPTTFYGGATETEGAEPITLKGGEHHEIEIRLSPVPALRLTFHGLEQGPNQIPVLQKRMFDSVQGVQITEIRPAGPGLYEVTGVPAGRYDVVARSAAAGSSPDVSEMNLTRDGQDLDDTHGEALGKLSVTVEPPAGEPLPAQYTVALRDAWERIVMFQPGDPSGKVSFAPLKPGKYGILVGSQGKRYSVVRTISGSGAAAGHQVNVASGADVDLKAVLAAGEVHVEGVVEKNGKPMAGVMVVLVPNDPEAHVDLFRRDQSDFDGTFSLPAVIPGTYTIVAVEDAWGFAWLKAGMLARYVQHGQNLIISEKMRGTLHLPEAVEVQSR
jgi:hypothetical protein